MKLIDDVRADWKVAMRWASVRLSALGIALTTAWIAMPQDLRDKMPYGELIAPAMFAFVILGRVTKGSTDA